MITRNFSSSEGFSSYVYEDRETAQAVTSPFTVSVLGMRQELLGVGTVIGSITDEDWNKMPVIAIQDQEETVEILGVECWWAYPVDELTAELLSRYIEAKSIVRATTYVELIEAEGY